MSTTSDMSTDAAALLQKCALFRALDGDARSRLAARAHRRRYASGDTIFTMGAPGDSLMAIALGIVRIKFSSPAGKEIVLADLSAGDVFGEVALLDGKERSADAVALTNCELLVLDRREVISFLEHNPHVCLRVMEMLCATLRRADERMADIAFLELPVRLAKILLRRSGHWPSGAGRTSKLSLSQAELASMVGGRRETVNRCLRDWERQGIIDLKDRWIIILDPLKLSAIAELE